MHFKSEEKINSHVLVLCIFRWFRILDNFHACLFWLKKEDEIKSFYFKQKKKCLNLYAHNLKYFISCLFDLWTKKKFRKKYTCHMITKYGLKRNDLKTVHLNHPPFTNDVGCNSSRFWVENSSKKKKWTNPIDITYLEFYILI